jgi:hypothetical protein
MRLRARVHMSHFKCSGASTNRASQSHAKMPITMPSATHLHPLAMCGNAAEIVLHDMLEEREKHVQASWWIGPENRQCPQQENYAGANN